MIAPDVNLTVYNTLGICNDAWISEKHTGFNVNKGRATCEDVLKFRETARDRVRAPFALELEWMNDRTGGDWTCS